MKKIYVIMLLSSFFVNGQQKLSGINYFDSNWNLSSSYNYQYYREAYRYSNGYYLFYDFYKNGTIQCEAYADYYNFACGKYPTDCGMKNGYIKWYYYNGNIKSKAYFHNGMLISEENWDIYGNKKSNITMQDVKEGIETIHEIVKFYKTLTQD